MSHDSIPARFAATSGDIASAAMSSMFDMTLGSRLTFAERLDPDVLSRAVRLLLDLEPVLGCWYHETLRNAEWVRCADGEVPFRMAESSDLDRDAAAFHAIPFDRRGPRLAALLLRSARHDELCVRFDHVAGDGWSAKEVAHLLAETYTHLLEDPGFVPAPRLSPRPSHADVWNAMSEEQRASAARPMPMAMSKWRMKSCAGAGSTFMVRSLGLSADRVSALRAHAHEQGATVNEALIAALVRAAASIFPPQPGVKPGVSISADPRRFAQERTLDRICCVATTQTVLMDYRHGESFDETLQHVVEGVKPHRDSLWSIGSTQTSTPRPVLLRAIFGLMVGSLRLLHGMALVTMNWGPFDEERLAFGEARPVAAVALGPIPRFPGFAVTITSYRDALTLSMGFRETYIAAGLIERCLDGIDEQLQAAQQSAA